MASSVSAPKLRPQNVGAVNRKEHKQPCKRKTTPAQEALLHQRHSPERDLGHPWPRTMRLMGLVLGKDNRHSESHPAEKAWQGAHAQRHLRDFVWTVWATRMATLALYFRWDFKGMVCLLPPLKGRLLLSLLCLAFTIEWNAIAGSCCLRSFFALFNRRVSSVDCQI